MRPLFLVLTVSLALAGCSGVDDAPLGGPNGGTTDPTDPNGGNPPPGTENDAGTVTPDAGGPIGKDASATDSGAPKDSGTPQQDSGPPPSQAPTWTQIFNDYMKSGTKGRCSSCHSEGSSASNLYAWLQNRGYISGASSALVDSNQSCLSWYGGNMPPSGPTSYGNAVPDMNAWAAAGAKNN